GDALSFETCAEAWFAEGENRRGWKRSTIAEYRSVRGRLVAWFGPMPFAAIRPRDVAEFIAGHELGASAVGRDVSLLHAIFVTAQKQELVESNPAANAERPKLPPFRPEILEPIEFARTLRAFVDEQARAAFVVLVLTGLRRHELQRLRWGDVSLTERVLRVRESKSRDGIRSIPLTPALVEALEGRYRETAFKGDAEFVFCHPE